MIRYLLDTDVVSRATKADGGNVRAWLATIDDLELAISAITVFELHKGLNALRNRDRAATTRVAGTVDAIIAAYAGRILALDEQIGRVWGASVTGDERRLMDKAQIAMAATHDLVLVTLNSKDMRGLGVRILNPGRKPAVSYGPID